MARTSLAFQRLRFCIFTAGVWVCSLVGELRPPHAVWYGQKKKKNPYHAHNTAAADLTHSIRASL